MSSPAASALRLGAAHFAHLRAVVEGLAIEDAAQRYLAADTRPAARAAHADVVLALEAVARRRNDPRWRLLGLIGLVNGGSDPRPRRAASTARAAAVALGAGQPPARGAEHDQDTPDRRIARARRLREQQLNLLHELQAIAAEFARPSDLIEGWFDAATAARLKRSGLLRLDELQQRIARGGRWYRWVPAIGPTKAVRIARYLSLLLPPARSGPSVVEQYAPLLAPPMPSGLSKPSGPANANRGALVSRAQDPRSLTSDVGEWAAGAEGLPANPGPRALPAEVDGSQGLNRSPLATAGLQACNDREAIEAWLVAKAGEPGQDGFVATTARSYRIEAERLLLWCIAERRRALSSMTAEDCAAYKAFLSNLPEGWISRRRALRYGPGWTPFAGQLTVTSQQHALTVVGALFRWLVAAHYLHANPWELVKTRLGDDPRRSALDSRAFTPAAWAAIVGYVQAQPPSPAQARAAFVLHFVEGVGLRAEELVSAELGQFRQVDDGLGWAMQIHGKGARNRVASVPPQAVRALDQYLAFRGLPPLGQASPSTPLVASVDDPRARIGYRALYDSIRSWIRRAISASSLASAQKDIAVRASLHWLRHTCGTRALERGVELPDLQGQFGHADPRTTMRYSKKQLQRRQGAFGKAFS